MKTCTHCGSAGPFYNDKTTKDGLSVWCTPCKKVARDNWRSTHRELVNAQSRAKLQRDKLKPDYKARMYRYSRKSRLKRRYGLTPQGWESLFDSQDRACAICRSKSPGVKGWSTDHDHDTNVVRGILCQFCNQAIGLMRDDPAVLSAAVEYLQRYK